MKHVKTTNDSTWGAPPDLLPGEGGSCGDPRGAARPWGLSKAPSPWAPTLGCAGSCGARQPRVCFSAGGVLLGNKAKCLKVRGKRPSAECWTRGGELSLSFPASLSARRRSWSAPRSPGSGREAAPEDPRGGTAPGAHLTLVLVAQGPAAAHSPAPKDAQAPEQHHRSPE